MFTVQTTAINQVAGWRENTRPVSGRVLGMISMPSQFATVVYDKGNGVLALPLKGVDRLDTSVKRVQRLNDIADEVVICHPTRGERNVHSLAHSKNGNMLYNSEILLLQ